MSGKYVERQVRETCPKCGGTQRVFTESGQTLECDRCEGPGYIIVTKCIPIDQINEELATAAADQRRNGVPTGSSRSPKSRLFQANRTLQEIDAESPRRRNEPPADELFSREPSQTGRGLEPL